MKIYTKEEIIGEWSGKTFRVKFNDDFSVDLVLLPTNNHHHGSFSIFQNFIVIKYSKENQEFNWVFKIGYINLNNLYLTDIN